MIQYIDNVFQFASATKKNKNISNNMESLTLQVDGPITQRAYILGGGGLLAEYFLCLRVDGLITGGEGSL